MAPKITGSALSCIHVSSKSMRRSWGRQGQFRQHVLDFSSGNCNRIYADNWQFQTILSCQLEQNCLHPGFTSDPIEEL